jgi:hypothetical protein
MKTSEAFAIGEWLTETPEFASYWDIMESLENADSWDEIEDIVPWEVVENYTPSQVAEFISVTKEHFEKAVGEQPIDI